MVQINAQKCTYQLCQFTLNHIIMFYLFESISKLFLYMCACVVFFPHKNALICPFSLHHTLPNLLFKIVRMKKWWCRQAMQWIVDALYRVHERVIISSFTVMTLLRSLCKWQHAACVITSDRSCYRKRGLVFQEYCYLAPVQIKCKCH